ncbi:MAG: transposase [Rhodospirillales bacterium]
MDTSLRVERRHRSWPEALKREIVAASFAPGASVSVVARHYDVNANQVSAWRKRLCDGSTASLAAQLVPVVVTPDRADTPPPAADIIEIELASGHRVRIGGGVKAASLRLMLDALERR